MNTKMYEQESKFENTYLLNKYTDASKEEICLTIDLN